MQNWLDHIRHIQPVSGVLHVGAGGLAAAALYAEWGIPSVVFVDAQAHGDGFDRESRNHPGWSRHTALLSSREGEVNYYLASNPSESGVLPPENLSALWQNLKTREKRQVNATTVDAFLASLDRPPQTFNWIVIDCLPALPVVRGAVASMANWDVVMARAILEEGLLPGQGASKAELDEFLGACGFRAIAYQEERQPALASVLYVRDWKAVSRVREAECQSQLARAVEAHDEQARICGDLQKQMEGLSWACGEHERVSKERLAHITKLSQEKEGLDALLAECQARLEQADQARLEQERLCEEFRRQAELLAQECGEHAQVSRERLAQIGELNQAYDAQALQLAGLQGQLEQALQEHDAQAKLAAEIQSRLEQTEKARDEAASLSAERLTMLEQLRAELHQARQTANLATKLQILRESDLQDLQKRYKESIATQERQHKLLRDLEERLRAAAQYFHQICEQQPLLANQPIEVLPKRRSPAPRPKKKQG